MVNELNEYYVKRILEYQTTIPVPIVQLANSFNIEVYKVPNMNEGISGAIINKNGVYTIYTNKNELERRRRFTIAHELAHYILHKDIINNHLSGNLTDAIDFSGIMYRSKLSSIFETDANKLAAEILMPLDKMKKFYYSLGYNMIKMSEEFNVSQQGIKIRIDNLYNIFLP